jgi:serine/threonine protein kinase
VGTPEYMSPEQAEGMDLNPQTDIYSLGIVLYEMLAGDPPFTGDNPLSIAYKHVNVQPPPLSEKRPEVSKRLDLIVLKALKKDRASRYKTATEFLEDLDRALEEPQNLETRGMQPLTGLKQKELFQQEKRVVDRRSSDRRRDSRRGYFRRIDDFRLDHRRRFWIIVAALVAAAVTVVVLVFPWRGKKPEVPPFLAEAGVEKIVGSGFPENALDENAATSWQAEGDNPGFTIFFAGPRKVNRLDIISGNHAAPESFLVFGRPKRLKFIFNDEVEFETQLEDVRERQVISLPQTLDAKKMKVVVLQTYPGSKSPVTCLSEIKCWYLPVN